MQSIAEAERRIKTGKGEISKIEKEKEFFQEIINVLWYINVTMIPIIHFIPLQQKDFPLLVHWLNQPHVAEWWPENLPWTIKSVTQKYQTYVDEYKIVGDKKVPIHAFIICADTKPIGYIQYYSIHDYAHQAEVNTALLPASCASFDVYIGDASFLGKGLGKKIIQQFLDTYIWPTFDAIFVAPDEKNIRAQAAYAACGFVKFDGQHAKNVVPLILYKI
jgi:aminoglycoside 6'-N-acetyltransferase